MLWELIPHGEPYALPAHYGGLIEMCLHFCFAEFYFVESFEKKKPISSEHKNNLTIYEFLFSKFKLLLF